MQNDNMNELQIIIFDAMLAQILYNQCVSTSHLFLSHNLCEIKSGCSLNYSTFVVVVVLLSFGLVFRNLK